MSPHYLVKSKMSLSTINRLGHSQLQLNELSKHKIDFFAQMKKTVTYNDKLQTLQLESLELRRVIYV